MYSPKNKNHLGISVLKSNGNMIVDSLSKANFQFYILRLNHYIFMRMFFLLYRIYVSKSSGTDFL